MPCLAMFGRCSAMQPDTSGMLVILEPEDLKALQWRNFFCADASRKFREDMESASAISWCAEVYFIISCEALILCNHFSSCVCTVCVCHHVIGSKWIKHKRRVSNNAFRTPWSVGPLALWFPGPGSGSAALVFFFGPWLVCSDLRSSVVPWSRHPPYRLIYSVQKAGLARIASAVLYECRGLAHLVI